ncbi:hypothetical protein ZIOFF_029298 [Zingiber officinale]|uniref:hexokinase n=1 Tax=Zingiber officinale TaxID=94328 RepID=A0A8J5LAH7_ZINOF|nr:hypothetical protein ZIOFF_029298 [Zingiber officinale]
MKARKVVIRVCNIVAKRGACLTATRIIDIMKKLGYDNSNMKRTVIAMDIRLNEHCTIFRESLEKRPQLLCWLPWPIMDQTLGLLFMQHLILSIMKTRKNLNM